MSTPHTTRSEMDQWVIQLDPARREELEKAFAAEESHKGVLETRDEAEHNEEKLVQTAKAEAEAIAANSLTWDTPYGKIYCSKRDESRFKSFQEGYQNIIGSWDQMAKFYKEMTDYEKSVPSRPDIMKEIAQSKNKVRPDVGVLKGAQQGLRLAAAMLDDNLVQLELAKKNLGFAITDLLAHVVEKGAKELREEVERFNDWLEIVGNTLKGASEMVENPVAGVVEMVEAINKVDDRMRDGSKFNEAARLAKLAEDMQIGLAADKLSAASESLTAMVKLYGTHRANLLAAQKLAKDDTHEATDSYNTASNGHFKFDKTIWELIKKANNVLFISWDEFKGLSDGVLKNTLWVSSHPRHKDTWEAISRMQKTFEAHLNDAKELQKRAQATMDKWTAVENDAKKALLGS